MCCCESVRVRGRACDSIAPAHTEECAIQAAYAAVVGRVSDSVIDPESDDA